MSLRQLAAIPFQQQRVARCLADMARWLRVSTARGAKTVAGLWLGSAILAAVDGLRFAASCRI